MKKTLLLLFCGLLFACSKDVTEDTLDNVSENPFKSPQIFMVIEEGKIDSIIQDVSLNSKKLLKKGIKKRVVTKRIDPLPKEATLQDVLNVLPKEIKYNEFYMNDSYIGYRGSLEIREPIHFEGGDVYAAQRLLIRLIRNSFV